MKKILFATFVILSLLITACGTNKPQSTTPTAIPTVIADDTIIAEGRVEPIQYAEIAFTTSGVISEVLVKEDQFVREGQPLIRLGDETDTNYTAALLELASAQHAYDELLNSRDTNFAQAVIELKDAQEAYDKAENYLQYLQTSQKVPQTEFRAFIVQTWKGYEYRYKQRNFKGPAPQDWIIEAENDLALKKAKFDEAQRAYDRLKDGPDAEELPLIQARLDAAEASVAAFTVEAPFDGIVAKINAKVGSSINAGQIAVTIVDTSSWIVKTTDVTEFDVVTLTKNQPATVTLDAIPEAAFNGTILSISQSYSENQGDVVYEVTILMTEASPAIRWGMTTAVKFEK